MKASGSASDLAIRARGLVKEFGPIRALDGLDLEIRRGEVYGFLGRNGAGKTTTIRILLGLVGADTGEVELFGLRQGSRRGEILGRVGYLVEGASAYPNLTVRENLEIQRRLKSLGKGSVEEAISLLGLDACADRPAGRLSLGNRQRLSLARALLGRPELLILDEPANGLDPAGIVEIRELLRRLASESGVTILMSSHILAEVDQLADRIGIVHGGRLLEEFDRGGLSRGRRRFIDIGLSSGDERDRAEGLLRSRLELSAIAPLGARELRVSEAGNRGPEMARVLVEAGLGLEMMRPVEEGLEERFMRLTGGAE